MARKFLVTGFEPFGGESVNPAWEAVRRLPDFIGSTQLAKLQVPTVFGQAGETVLRAAEQIQPDAIICIGQAGGRSKVTPEVLGINRRDAVIADNAGQQPWRQPIVTDGPDAIFSTLPVYAMTEAAQARELPCALSYSAGAFVCNDLLYTLLHRYRNTATHVGFIHVPYLPAQAAEGIPSLPLETVVETLTVLLQAIEI